ncbi:MAG: hypothetical protein MdMp014T_0314 [Treponematales bacterium]
MNSSNHSAEKTLLPFTTHGAPPDFLSAFHSATVLTPAASAAANRDFTSRPSTYTGFAAHLFGRSPASRLLIPRHLKAAHDALTALASALLCFILFIDFWTLTAPGKRLLEKIHFIDIRESEIAEGIHALIEKAAARRFELFACLAGLAATLVAVSRAANTGMTTDEASTYFDVIFPGIIEALMRSQFLNNHILNSVLIRLVGYVTQTRLACNELLIRLPSLVFYGVYIVFAYRAAKETRQRYLIFLLFIANYYLSTRFPYCSAASLRCIYWSDRRRA